MIRGKDWLTFTIDDERGVLGGGGTLSFIERCEHAVVEKERAHVEDA